MPDPPRTSDSGPNPGLLLDRDGVITINREHYVLSWDDVAFYPGSLEALSSIGVAHHKIAIVTNQSAVGQGLLSLQEADDINRRIVEAVVSSGGRIDRVFMCPHHAQFGCSCRKPRPGLIQQAIGELNLDPSQSILIGDAASDIESGFRAGIGQLVLVRTGRGQSQEARTLAANYPHLRVFDDLRGAIKDLFAQSQ